MEYREFVEEVKGHGGLGSADEAERAIEATLTTLAERVPADDTKDIALMLPRELRRILQQPLGRGLRGTEIDDIVNETTGPTPHFSDQQGGRVPVREGLGISKTEREVRRGGVPLDREAFVERVGRRENVSADQAERHVSAVFAALSRAITGEQVRYMREHLLRGELDDLFPASRGEGQARRDDPRGGHGRRRR